MSGRAFRRVIETKSLSIRYLQKGKRIREGYAMLSGNLQGNELEKLPDFVQRLKRKFPKATFVQDTNVDLEAMRVSVRTSLLRAFLSLSLSFFSFFF